MWKLREITDKVTNVVMNYTEIEAKVREATNDDPWGPTGHQMQEIAQGTFSYEQFPEVMGMLWRRMLQDKKNWRRTYKSLLVLAYLVKNGSERVVTSTREHIYDLRSLESYHFIDECGKDQGINVRQRVKELIEFIQDDEKLRQERKKAKKSKDKYVGMSSNSQSSRYDKDLWKEKDDFENFQSHQNTVTSRFSLDKGKSYEDIPDSNDEDKISNESDLGIREIDLNSPRKQNIKNINKQDSPMKKKGLKKVDLGAAAVYGKKRNVFDQECEDKKTSLIDHSFQESLSVDGIAKEQKSKSTDQDLLGDLVDLTPENQSGANGDFADFSKFQGASDTQLTNQEEFGDFASFPSVASPGSGFPNKVGFLEPTMITASTLPLHQHSIPSTITQGLTGTLCHQSSPITNIVPQPGLGIGSTSTNLESQKCSSATGQLHQPGMRISLTQFYPNNFVGQSSGMVITGGSLNPGVMPLFNTGTQNMGVSSQPQSLTSFNGSNYGLAGSVPVAQPTSYQVMSPTSAMYSNVSAFAKMSNQSPAVSATQKTNTWSHSGNVDISVDNLLPVNKYMKPAAPSMNQLASVNNLTSHMQQMSLGHVPQQPLGASNSTPAFYSPKVGNVTSPVGNLPQNSEMGAAFNIQGFTSM
ncbi:clathrin interactor 1-like isoform X2 [Tachypleus tridentatus]|uniref:clathrin interactor 1-like isoform X2 n=1 Tax=Tachypleus tridentatus TaxID=6853 RepID=UPI003FD205B3